MCNYLNCVVPVMFVKMFLFYFFVVGHTCKIDAFFFTWLNKGYDDEDDFKLFNNFI